MLPKLLRIIRSDHPLNQALEVEEKVKRQERQQELVSISRHAPLCSRKEIRSLVSEGPGTSRKDKCRTVRKHELSLHGQQEGSENKSELVVEH